MLNLKKIDWKALLALKAKNDNKEEISLFDVKELYDAAYEEKAKARVNLKKFHILLQKAAKLDEAYRIQLTEGQKRNYGRVA